MSYPTLMVRPIHLRLFTGVILAFQSGQNSSSITVSVSPNYKVTKWAIFCWKVSNIAVLKMEKLFLILFFSGSICKYFLLMSLMWYGWPSLSTHPGRFEWMALKAGVFRGCFLLHFGLSQRISWKKNVTKAEFYFKRSGNRLLQTLWSAPQTLQWGGALWMECLPAHRRTWAALCCTMYLDSQCWEEGPGGSWGLQSRRSGSSCAHWIWANK